MKKEISFGLSLVPLITLIGAAMLSSFYWKAGMHIPLLIGVISAAVIANFSGWSWDDIQKMLVNGVSRALPAIFIMGFQLNQGLKLLILF